MKSSMSVTITSLSTSSTVIKLTSLLLLTFSVFILFKYVALYPEPTAQTNHHHLSFFDSSNAAAPAAPLGQAAVERTGIINEMGLMTDDFIVGEFDESLIKNMVLVVNDNKTFVYRESDERKLVKFDKFRTCDASLSDYVPCFDNVDAISRLISSKKGVKYERHCPESGGEGLDCLVPRPKEYKIHIPWPKSRNEVWFHNVPHSNLVGHNGDQNRLLRKDDKLTFEGETTVYAYLDQISQLAPDIAFGRHTRIVLDIDGGAASFGAYLMDQNVTTLSISQKNVNENPVQLALERGVPSMLTAFGTHRFPYPSQAFDLIHCSKNCRIDWTRDAGILLIEANRILRAGRYFILATTQTNEEKLKQQWEGNRTTSDIENLTRHLCWKLVNRDGSVAIWQKPVNNSCYLNQDPAVQPSLCDSHDNPDDIWNVDLQPCITHLPENGYGANVTDWPARLHNPQDRLFTIQMDAYKSRRELYRADSIYWNDIVKGYIDAFSINKGNIRNVMDMKAGYGGYAAALLDFQVNSWVMNVLPITSPNTLPLIYDRGLIGVMHDWCEPFDTYPRTYDMLHASGLFSAERKRCNMTSIMLEMDRILRPDGRAYIHDMTAVIYQLEEIGKAVGWVTYMFDSGEGSHSNWKLLIGEKRL